MRKFRDLSIAVLMGLFGMQGALHADPLKRGRVLCEGEACLGGEAGGIEGDGNPLTKAVPDFVASPVVSTKKKTQAKTLSPKPIPTREAEQISNLPRYYQGVSLAGVEASDRVVFVPKSPSPKLKGVKPGDVFWAIVDQELVASPEMPTPIRATVTSGRFRGARFVGEATLEKELKRVCLSFKALSLSGGDETYTVKATGLSPEGSVCLEGEYVSHTGKFFLAELASAAASGFLDSTIDRNQTSLGTYVQEPSLSNSGKTASVTALSKTTDRMAEQVRQSPEYTRVSGFQVIQIMIQDGAVEE